MLNSIESWIVNKFAGKVSTQVVVIVASYLSSAPVRELLAKLGVSITVDQAALQAGVTAFAAVAYEWFKKRRRANPASPAVQTDPDAPMAHIPANGSIVAPSAS